MNGKFRFNTTRRPIHVVTRPRSVCNFSFFKSSIGKGKLAARSGDESRSHTVYWKQPKNRVRHGGQGQI